MQRAVVPVLFWLRDPDHTVWAIDAANVMTKAPDAEPVRDVEWDELDQFIPAGTMMASSAYFAWALTPGLEQGKKLLRVVFPWWYWTVGRVKRR